MNRISFTILNRNRYESVRLELLLEFVSSVYLNLIEKVEIRHTKLINIEIKGGQDLNVLQANFSEFNQVGFISATFPFELIMDNDSKEFIYEKIVGFIKLALQFYCQELSLKAPKFPSFKLKEYKGFALECDNKLDEDNNFNSVILYKFLKYDYIEYSICFKSQRAVKQLAILIETPIFLGVEYPQVPLGDVPVLYIDSWNGNFINLKYGKADLKIDFNLSSKEIQPIKLNKLIGISG